MCHLDQIGLPRLVERNRCWRRRCSPIPASGVTKHTWEINRLRPERMRPEKNAPVAADPLSFYCCLHSGSVFALVAANGAVGIWEFAALFALDGRGCGFGSGTVAGTPGTNLNLVKDGPSCV